MIQHYFRIAFRQIMKNKGQYLLSLFGVAIGLICFSMTNYYIRKATNQYYSWPNASRMAKICIKAQHNENETFYFSGSALQKLVDNPVAGIEKITWAEPANNQNITFRKGDDSETPFLCNVLHISTDFIPVYSLESLSGEIPSLNPGEVLISKEMAAKVYGNENPIGNVLYTSRSDNDTTAIAYATIRAVIKDLPENTRERCDLYFLHTEPIQPEKNYWHHTTVLSQKDIGFKEINERLSQQYPIAEEGKEESRMAAMSFTSILTKSDDYAGVLILGIVGSLILISAMINFLKLCIQSFYNRSREISLRKNLGANQTSLFFLLFTEIGSLLVIGLGLTFVLTEVLLPFVFFYLPETLKTNPTVQVKTSVLLKQQIEYLLLLLIICAAICYIVVSRLKHINLIKGIRGGTNKHYLRNFMLGFQIAICFLFIAGATGLNLVRQSMDDIRNKTLTDEERKSIWLVNLNQPQLSGHESEIINEIRSLTGVEDILFETNSGGMDYKAPNGTISHGGNSLVSGNYTDFMKLPIEGRMPVNSNEIAVSRSLIWILEDNKEDTHSVLLGDNMYYITGIYEQLPFYPVVTKEQFRRLEDYNKFSLLTVSDAISTNLQVKALPGFEESVKAGIQRIVRKRLPETIPFQLVTLHYRQSLDSGGGATIIRDLFILLSFISLVITIMGIYSAITLDSEKRQKEVAVRKINGASPKEIALLFGNMYVRLLVIAAIPAFSLVYLFLYGLMNTEIPIFTGWLNNPLLWLSVFVFVCIIVFVTVAYRIRLVMNLNPADIIKNE